MTSYIFVNKHIIYKNARNGTNDPPVGIRKTKTGKAKYCHEVDIQGPSKLVYSPDKPILKCGARLVLITESEVVLK